jgi:hypothetical protein
VKFKIQALAVLLAVLATICQAQQAPKNLKKLDTVEATNVWARIAQAPVAQHRTHAEAIVSAKKYPNSNTPISVGQAPAVMEVLGSPNQSGPVAVYFSSIRPLVSDTVLAMQMTMPDGTQVPLQTYKIYPDPNGSSSGYNINTQLWNGPFPWAWPSGDTIFTAFVVPPSGSITYVSTVISVNSCCGVFGPLDRADVSDDGTVVKIQGFFGGDTFATINETPVEITFPATNAPVNYNTTGAISLANFGQGQMTLTVCSGGECSTRIIYATSPAKG